MTEPDRSMEPIFPLADPPAAVFIGRVGSGKLVSVELPYIEGPNGSIGLPAGPLDEVVVDLKLGDVLWIKPPGREPAGSVDPEEGPIDLFDGRFRLDAARREVVIDGVAHGITRREFSILEVLTRKRGSIVTRSQLVDELFGGLASDRAVDVYIAALRKKMGGLKDVIRTVRGAGYMLDDACQPGATEVGAN